MLFPPPAQLLGDIQEDMLSARCAARGDIQEDMLLRPPLRGSSAETIFS
jgi:hypothetical protein